MTRETKVGLVVSFSFLCLVGVVLAKRLLDRHYQQLAETAASTDLDEPVPVVEDPKPQTDSHASVVPSQPSVSEPNRPALLTVPPPQPLPTGEKAEIQQAQATKKPSSESEVKNSPSGVSSIPGDIPLSEQGPGKSASVPPDTPPTSGNRETLPGMDAMDAHHASMPSSPKVEGSATVQGPSPATHFPEPKSDEAGVFPLASMAGAGARVASSTSLEKPNQKGSPQAEFAQPTGPPSGLPSQFEPTSPANTDTTASSDKTEKRQTMPPAALPGMNPVMPSQGSSSGTNIQTPPPASSPATSAPMPPAAPPVYNLMENTSSPVARPNSSRNTEVKPPPSATQTGSSPYDIPTRGANSVFPGNQPSNTSAFPAPGTGATASPESRSTTAPASSSVVPQPSNTFVLPTPTAGTGATTSPQSGSTTPSSASSPVAPLAVPTQPPPSSTPMPIIPIGTLNTSSTPNTSAAAGNNGAALQPQNSTSPYGDVNHQQITPAGLGTPSPAPAPSPASPPMSSPSSGSNPFPSTAGEGTGNNAPSPARGLGSTSPDTNGKPPYQTDVHPEGGRFDRPGTALPTNPSMPNPDTSSPTGGNQDPRPALGAPVVVTAPPIVVGPTTPAIRPKGQSSNTDVFTEEIYICQPGDTMASISKRKYLTDQYAQALLLYNRQHPEAGDRFVQDSPALQPGQRVYVPETRILEARYPTAIRGLTPLPASAPRDQPTTPSAEAAPGLVVPVTPAPAAGVPVTARSSVPASTRWISYRVSPPGATFREIARRTLGNGERWAEIYKLNPSYRPEYMIPEGVTLRLPPDARID